MVITNLSGEWYKDINNNFIATPPLRFFNHTASSIIKGEDNHYKIPILTFQQPSASLLFTKSQVTECQILSLCKDIQSKRAVGVKYPTALFHLYIPYYFANCKPFSLSHAPRVKSGISTGAPPLFTEISVNSVRQDHSAAS